MHTRCRYRFLPQYFRSGSIDTLDAGCGNVALAYRAYKLGNRVIAVTNDSKQVSKARSFFYFLGVDSSRLQFEVYNLYDLPKLGKQFDQIICSETLEHIRRDDIVIHIFYELLRPNGLLHLCSPFALHPAHNLGRIDGIENGGHVRDGYSKESYRVLLEPVGFKIINYVGLGSPILYWLDKPIRWIRNKAGDIAALPLFLITLPLQRFDYINPTVPFSLYIQAVK